MNLFFAMNILKSFDWMWLINDDAENRIVLAGINNIKHKNFSEWRFFILKIILFVRWANIDELVNWSKVQV